MLIHAESLGECWLKCIRLVLENGTVAMDEDTELREILGVTLGISTPDLHDEIIRQHGNQQVIERTLQKFAKGVRMADRPFTYGERIFEAGIVDQFEWLVHRLLGKRDTKSATIGLLIPGEPSSMPCLTTIDAKIRNNNLDVQFFYRSQNVFGRQYANLLALTSFQADLASRCGVAIGALRGYIASAHIYDFDITDARRLISGDPLIIQDRYYTDGPQSMRARS